MLAENKFKILQDLIEEASNEELAWINGYLNGIVSTKEPKGKTVSNNAINKITIAYGTETGNSKKLATDFASKARKKGINVKVQSLDQYRLTDLQKEEYFLTVISTHGDGEPPAAAKKFYDHVHNNGFKLDNLKYGVLALGDSSYPLYCQAGEDVDKQLNKLGAQRIAPLQKCDIDYHSDADDWFNEICKTLHTDGSNTLVSTPHKIPNKCSGRKLYHGNLLAHVNLNDRGSNKETYHIEIEADEVAYIPGDSIGIIPENKKDTVEKIISLTGTEKTSYLDYKDELITIHDLLLKKLNITFLPERVVKQYASVIKKELPVKRIDLVDLLQLYPVTNSNHFVEIIKILEPITPRLYSIASSPAAHPGEIHITVAKNKFNLNGKTGFGLASEFLSGFKPGHSFEFYIHPNNRFRLPSADANIIMIGPGTGIAPFRSFIAEREATGATGKNWLFFGEQHFITDFLYQSEIQNWFETGVLTKVSTAFSRDQQEKVYVQNKMMQQGKEFFEWLQSGAFVYVCGNKDPMSVDVENTIVTIIEKFGERSGDDAVKYLDSLKEDERYITDVY